MRECLRYRKFALRLHSEILVYVKVSNPMHVLTLLIIPYLVAIKTNFHC